MFTHDISNLAGLDFETYGSVDLPKHGLDRYIADPNFMPLIADVAINDDYARTQTVIEHFDFTEKFKKNWRAMLECIGQRKIVAHNAPFEQAVLGSQGNHYPSTRFIDSAVVARAAGAGGKLEVAGPQLLGIDKMEEGWPLIKLFSMPGSFQEANENMAFDPDIIKVNPEKWTTFGIYCGVDAKLGLHIVLEFLPWLTQHELEYQAVTMDMNKTGWFVDLDLVKEMELRRTINQEKALTEFNAKYFAPDEEPVNLNSTPQMQKWALARGIRSKSFDESNVERILSRLEAKLEDGVDDEVKRKNYEAVADMLRTKQIIGGSSLKKLDVILNTTGDDNILRDQYLHCGAGQTLRTTGRSVQMQNLKRIDEEPDDVTLLTDKLALDSGHDWWTNDRLARNIRQVFTSSHPQGRLIVGDFKGVENRGLAWLAGQEDKLKIFREGKLDVYKVLGAKMYGVQYDVVTKDQRQAGKVGELSCGYQAAAEAVQSFAAGMGIYLTIAEAETIVRDWRMANPQIVEFWEILDTMLREWLATGKVQSHALPDRLMLQFSTVPTPKSLTDQVGPKRELKSLCISVYNTESREVILKRFFIGCHTKGRNVGYYRPTDRKTGDLWKDWYTNQKTKRKTDYTIYGGKLAGILTQSFCRELFFEVLLRVHDRVQGWDNVSLVGQFHDEIDLDWVPGNISLDRDFIEKELTDMMSYSYIAPSFPLAADVKSDYRYTK